MSYTVQAHRTSDTGRPPSYRDVNDSELLLQDRVNRPNKPEEHYNLVPGRKPTKSLDDTLPLEDNREKFQHLTVISPSAPEASDNDGEFCAKLNV